MNEVDLDFVLKSTDKVLQTSKPVLEEELALLLVRFLESR